MSTDSIRGNQSLTDFQLPRKSVSQRPNVKLQYSFSHHLLPPHTASHASFSLFFSVAIFPQSTFIPAGKTMRSPFPESLLPLLDLRKDLQLLLPTASITGHTVHLRTSSLNSYRARQLAMRTDGESMVIVPCHTDAGLQINIHQVAPVYGLLLDVQKLFSVARGTSILPRWY